METYTAARPLVENLDFEAQRRACLADFGPAICDAPIRELIRAINRLPWCFTLQSCYGHFTYPGQSDPHNLAPLPPAAGPGPLTYRIAYLALCVDPTPPGRAFLDALAALSRLDPANLQFGSADWFWARQVNSYIVQVEPERFKYLDQAQLTHAEAVGIERLRAVFFERLGALVAAQ